jgi:peptidoglycan/LPS O-acetylase OafA/YrhL
VNDGLAPDTDADRRLRTLRLWVLAALGLCALVIAGSAGSPEPDMPPPNGYIATAIGLAIASILLRLRGSAPGRSTRLEVRLIAGSLALAGAIGIVAVLLTLSHGQWRTALFYTLAGAMLSIRTPSAPRPAPRDD